MKFSVIIPLYNGAKFIKATLDSVLAQTYKNYEIILVNDESPDNVGEIVKKYISNHSQAKFVYLEQKNKGLGGARNTAIKHASGEIIAILDQDDLWYPNKLERVAQAFTECIEATIVSHNLHILGSNGQKEIFVTGPFENEMHRKMLFEGNRLMTLATCFKKDIIERIGYFLEDVDKFHFLEDYELWLRMALANCKFCFIPDILASYNQHQESFSSKYTERMSKSEVNVLNLHYKLLIQKRFFDWYRLRRRRASLWFDVAYQLFFQKNSFIFGGWYLLLTILNDPFFLFFRLAKYIKEKILKK